jgi:uncharacterized protein (UPF0212 family)
MSEIPCPHCGKPINPAAMLAKIGLKSSRRDTSSAAMKKLRAKRTKKQQAKP